jgi:hypothetical protein
MFSILFADLAKQYSSFLRSWLLFNTKNNDEQYSKLGTIKSLKSEVLNLDGNIFRFLDSMKVLLLTFLSTKSM